MPNVFTKKEQNNENNNENKIVSDLPRIGFCCGKKNKKNLMKQLLDHKYKNTDLFP